MANLVECNIVLPKIITITDEREGEKIILKLRADNNITLSHTLIIKPEKEELGIDQMRRMQDDLRVSYSKQLLVVVYDLDFSGIEVQNSLLKIIEEESERFIFVFLVKNPSRLLPTILSRCSLVTEGPFKKPPTRSFENFEDFFSFVRNSDSTKDDARDKIDLYLLSGSLTRSKNLDYIIAVRKLILDNNINPILALDSILLFLSKRSTIKLQNDKKK